MMAETTTACASSRCSSVMSAPMFMIASAAATSCMAPGIASNVGESWIVTSCGFVGVGVGSTSVGALIIGVGLDSIVGVGVGDEVGSEVGSADGVGVGVGGISWVTGGGGNCVGVARASGVGSLCIGSTGVKVGSTLGSAVSDGNGVGSGSGVGVGSKLGIGSIVGSGVGMMPL